MSSLKSLLKSKKQSTQLIHPYAKYDSSNRLSCTLCGLPIKSELLWSSHLLNKSHRSKVNLEKLELEKKVAAAAVAAAAAGSGSNGGKRKRVEGDGEEEVRGGEKKVREEEEDDDDVNEEEEEESTEAGGSAIPDDFFSDASMRPQPSVPSPSPSPEPEPEPVEVEVTEPVDEEWAAFEASLAGEKDSTTTTSILPIGTTGGGGSNPKATVFSAPIMYEFGAPKVLEEGEEEEVVNGTAQGEADEEEEETEEEKAERLDREEREEMLARITEETTEQEMADEKVLVLKRRLEKIKEAREARKKKV